ncbi:hypothetical protein BASA50_009116 [Batrachochytrium salamandrivorans]|uniref:Uncharacterized protein n=1 Tax=Batrachochytrium salamandrivorans TaxID=1357716 RepID=A0ABQ8F2U0_9FUNG|nr:hypothetical protein BASA60_006307 [Batrachochytrium salamandrivorans]KAH6577817.1 hypothetical protein BASA62_000687 [Batrachochytrium salamandrivorans]KAH6578785.1 hypothetical protein BASA61_000014 [Batrachochytrium salamandrivorans]KAH6591114.1 hypothetical protein BASA50_009116 [Batrachochytrium salamandrivorans]KAH9268774.1 hypothetical protein BASA84_000073 [Batrachochytrium salamandrivorans]
MDTTTACQQATKSQADKEETPVELPADVVEEASPEPIVPMHFLKKSGNPLLGRLHKSNPLASTSPTDNIMSPATKKVEAKRGRLLNTIKPKSLNSRFAEAAEPSTVNDI